MNNVSTRAVLAAPWVALVCVTGIVSNLNSLLGWTVLGGVAVVLPVVMMWRWHAPVPTMSESIQEAVR